MVVQERGRTAGQRLPTNPSRGFLGAEQTDKPEASPVPRRLLPYRSKIATFWSMKKQPLSKRKPQVFIFLFSTGLTIKISYKSMLITKGRKTPLWQVSAELQPLTVWVKATGAGPPLPFVALFEFSWLMLYVHVYWGTAFKRIVYHSLVINLP